MGLIALITMPWDSLKRPSIQLGTLKQVLARAGHPDARVLYFNLAFAEHLLQGSASHAAPITVGDYEAIAAIYHYRGLGDWIFAVPPFLEASAQRDADYVRYLRERGVPEPIIGAAQRARALAPSFLDRCCAEVIASGARVVGFTTMFSQSAASLTLARLLKERDPSIRIVFGGANCDGPMGAALHRAFPWVDVVVRGEAERVLPPLIEDLLAGHAPRRQPGLCLREGGESIAVEPGGAPVSMDDVPTPDYIDYFEQLEGLSFHGQILHAIELQIESARGCWWGEKQHCTFCGLNGSTMAFRSKSPARVYEEAIELSARYQIASLHAVDNIIDMAYLQDLLPRLARAPTDLTIFYETKANLKKDQLRLMRDAGLRRIQPGIESLSTPILRLVRKGVTALHNVRLLKWCAQLGVKPLWNIMYGIPGEPPEEYERMTRLMPALIHLPPPHTSPLGVERFSPYHARPGDFGLEITGPARHYRYCFPADEETLRDLAYAFEFRYTDGRDPQAYLGPFLQAVQAWRDGHRPRALCYTRGPGFLIIDDERASERPVRVTLEGQSAAIYLACDAGASPARVCEALAESGEGRMDPGEAQRLLDQFVEAGLAYEEGGRYLSLAVPAFPENEDRAHYLSATQTAPERADEEPALVQISRRGRAPGRALLGGGHG